MAEGKTTKQIASALHLSKKTVDTHRAHVMEKLDAGSVAELVKHAIREGLTSVDAVSRRPSDFFPSRISL